jgi:cobalt-precorrin-5B (C1)-methyltransferase
MTSPREPELREPDLHRQGAAQGAAHRLDDRHLRFRCGQGRDHRAARPGHTQTVEVALPSGRRVAFAVGSCVYDLRGATAVVVKDVGDDPDVAHGAHLTATVRWRAEPGIVLGGGEGVGVVTRPGLGIDVGEPAITSTPRAMIIQAVGEVVDPAKRGVLVIISVPGGEKMARKTTNGRLGILGRISILCTTGIVRPFSTASWRASVEQSVSVMAAQA